MGYAERAVAPKHKGKDLIVSTIAITDRTTANYETAISNKKFNHGNWIVVELYTELDKAKEGHEKWIQFLSVSLPESLVHHSLTKGPIIIQRGD